MNSTPHSMPDTPAPRVDSLVRRQGKVVNMPLYRLACDLERELIQAQGYEANWRKALEERDKANELCAYAGVKLNTVLAQRNVAVKALRDALYEVHNVELRAEIRRAIRIASLV